MTNLIERLRDLARGRNNPIGDALTEAADAIEEAQEDAERLDWMASEARMLSGWRETGRWELLAIQIDSARDYCLTDDLRAAIDADRMGYLND